MENNKERIKEFYYEVNEGQLREYLKMPAAMKVKWLEETLRFLYKVKRLKGKRK
ncbi:hypothetical protein J7L48_07970 [bacterium]|nr:hypothetical protein [bacterium]